MLKRKSKERVGPNGCAFNFYSLPLPYIIFNKFKNEKYYSVKQLC